MSRTFLTSIRRGSLAFSRRQAVVSAPKFYSQKSLENYPTEIIKETIEPIDIDNTQENESIPWYLREDSSSPLIESKKIDLPTISESAPATLETFMNLLAYDYGLQDIALFDLTTLDEAHAYNINKQPARYVLISTGKSEKHIYKAASELRMYIKHNHGIIPPIEGMVSAGTSPAARRRLLKRARKGPMATDNDYGKSPNSWVMCDSKVDDIYVHIMTQERRDELNLESMYCPREEIDKYTPKQDSSLESDDIFIGIRRLYHTATLFSQKNHKNANLLATRRLYSTATKSVYHKLISENTGATKKTLANYKSEFDSIYVPTSLDDYRAKLEFYKALHILEPEIVSFSDIENVIEEKYLSLKVMLDSDIDMSTEKSNDIITYMKLLVDSPELMKTVELSESKNSVGLHADQLFDKLSHMISKLLRFSNQQVDLVANPEFIPLLWRLTFIGNQAFLGSSVINEIVYNSAPIPQPSVTPIISQAKNRARDILDLIKYYNTTSNKSPTLAFKELVLFTYGNDGNWPAFWNEWDVSFGLTQDSAQKMSSWVRLVVYLASRNDQSAMLHFLYNYWRNSTTSTTAFTEDFIANSSQFNSQQDKKVFVMAIDRILSTIHNGDDTKSFSYVKSFTDSL